MGTEFPRGRVIAIAAFEPWSGPDCLQLGPETAQDNGNDQIRGPLAQAVCKPTGENWPVGELDDLITDTKTRHGYGFGHRAFALLSLRFGELGVPASGMQLRQALDTLGGLFRLWSFWFGCSGFVSLWLGFGSVSLGWVSGGCLRDGPARSVAFGAARAEPARTGRRRHRPQKPSSTTTTTALKDKLSPWDAKRKPAASWQNSARPLTRLIGEWPRRRDIRARFREGA